MQFPFRFGVVLMLISGVHPALGLLPGAAALAAGSALAYLPQAAPASSPCDDRDRALAAALGLRQQGDGAAALACLEQARASHPDDPVLLTDLGVQAFDLQHLPEAAEALTAALKLQPNDPTAQYALARVELDRQHMPQAEALFRAYLAQQPTDASAHYGLGHLMQMSQRNDEAAAEFRLSIHLQPAQTESYYQLGQMDLDLHHDAEARELFTRVLSRFPAHGGALTGMGILDFRGKNYPAARRSLEAAIAASPEYQPSHYYLGLTLARLGDAAGSARELGRAADLAALQQGKSAPIGVISTP